MDVVLRRPVHPGFHIFAKFHVHEPVGQRGRHGGGDCHVLNTVANGADVPTVRNLVEIAEATVENQLVGRV